MQHVASILSFGCRYTHDLISIALNTAGIPLCYNGNGASSVADVLWMSSLLVLASGDLVPLVMDGSKFEVTAAGGNFISWATNPHQGILDDRLPNRLPDSISGITREYIELDILVFESSPKPPSAASQAKALQLIAAHELNAIADGFLTLANETVHSTVSRLVTLITHQTNPLHSFIHTFLSLSLDNGLRWILQFPLAESQSATDIWMYGTLGSNTDDRLTAAAHSLLALFQPPSESANTRQQPKKEEEESITILNLIQFLAALLDPRFYLVNTHPRRVPFNANDNTGTAFITPPVSNRSYIAVPTAIAHLPSWFYRAWVLEPFDPAAPAERLTNLLLPGEGREKGGKEAEGEGEEEKGPVILTSDSEKDERAPMPSAEGAAWRMRTKNPIYGVAQSEWERVVDSLLDARRTGDGVVLLRRQRVYGAENYP
jgi:hypothetical protein